MAATSPADLTLKLDMTYSTPDKHGRQIEQDLQNTFQLKANDSHWTTLADTPARRTHKHPQLILLQGKITDLTDQTATVQFLVTDLNHSEDVMFKPKIIARYGQASKIAIHDKNRNLELTVTLTH